MLESVRALTNSWFFFSRYSFCCLKRASSLPCSSLSFIASSETFWDSSLTFSICSSAFLFWELNSVLKVSISSSFFLLWYNKDSFWFSRAVILFSFSVSDWVISSVLSSNSFLSLLKLFICWSIVLECFSWMSSSAFLVSFKCSSRFTTFCSYIDSSCSDWCTMLWSCASFSLNSSWIISISSSCCIWSSRMRCS